MAMKILSREELLAWDQYFSAAVRVAFERPEVPDRQNMNSTTEEARVRFAATIADLMIGERRSRMPN